MFHNIKHAVESKSLRPVKKLLFTEVFIRIDIISNNLREILESYKYLQEFQTGVWQCVLKPTQTPEVCVKSDRSR